MTSQTIPACKNCKHYYEYDEFLGLCKFHYFERHDYINGSIDKVDMIAFEVREDKNRCGVEGRNFEEVDIPVETPRVSKRTQLKNIINKIWKYFSRYDTELF